MIKGHQDTSFSKSNYSKTMIKEFQKNLNKNPSTLSKKTLHGWLNEERQNRRIVILTWSLVG
jgi:hypothetical protein